jgi:diguanylate cyclase (GGDEF)-like protein/PAS domain S-box-containing protein
MRKTEWVFKKHFMTTRILMSGTVLLIGFGVAVFLFVQAFAEDLYAEKRQGLKHIVSLATNSMEPILEDRRNGKITMAQARVRSTEVVKRFVYSDNNGINYLFLTTDEGYLLVEPTAEEAVGTYQMQRRDSEGVLVTQALLKKAKAGGGFVEYLEARTANGVPEKKISYVVSIPDIECYVGTGMYVNDLDEAVKRLLTELLVLGLLIFTLVFGLQYYSMRPLLYCVKLLSASFKRLSEDPASLLSLTPDDHPHDPNTKGMIDNFTSMMKQLQSHRDVIEQHAEKFRQIAYAATDVIWQWEGSTGRTHWSENICDILGESPGTELPHFEVIEAWVHVDDREKRRQVLAVYLAQETETYVCEYRIQTSGGNYHWVQARGVATFDDKVPVRMVGSLLDLTGFMQHTSAASQEPRTVGVSEQFPQTIEGLMVQTPSIPPHALVIDVKNRLEAEQWQGFVVAENEAPVGLVMKNSLNQQLSGQYGVSLYYNRPIAMVMDSAPLIVEADSSLDKVSVCLQSRPADKLYDLIVVSRRGKYIGTASVMDIVTHLTDLRIQLAANANPLTGLPGNRVIDEKIRAAVQHNQAFVALCLDLDHFKAFNDKYGFARGDAVIKVTAGILKNATDIYGGQDAFTGHIGGDDFIILLYESVPYVLLAEQIIRSFDAEIRNLYSAEDLAQSCIAVQNRKGEYEEYPIMTISIAIIDSHCNRFTNPLEVAEVAAALKHLAKSRDGSVWVSDRRS